MKVLLKKNINKLGDIGDIVNIADGYARNYLLPKKFATLVTPGNVKQINLQRKKQEEKNREEMERLQALANEISNVSCTITVKTNKEGKLFGSVTAHHIADELSKQGYRIDENMIILETPIKKCDLYNVSVVLHPEIKPRCKVWVISESEKPSSPKKEPSELPFQSNSEEEKK